MAGRHGQTACTGKARKGSPRDGPSTRPRAFCRGRGLCVKEKERESRRRSRGRSCRRARTGAAQPAGAISHFTASRPLLEAEQQGIASKVFVIRLAVENHSCDSSYSTFETVPRRKSSIHRRREFSNLVRSSRRTRMQPDCQDTRVVRVYLADVRCRARGMITAMRRGLQEFSCCTSSRTWSKSCTVSTAAGLSFSSS